MTNTLWFDLDELDDMEAEEEALADDEKEELLKTIDSYLDDHPET